MRIELTKSEKFKSHLILTYQGDCEKGSAGNPYADFIIEQSKNELLKDNSIQGLILDLTNFRYEIGNRVANILLSNSYRNNKKLFIRVIPNKVDINNWESLINDCTNLLPSEIIQNDVKEAVKSINSQMNN